MQLEKVLALRQHCRDENLTFALDGAPSEPISTPNGKGYFLSPSIIDNPPADSRIVVEEPFGPIVPVFPWTELEDVLRQANGLETGLGASVWCKDEVQAVDVGRRMAAGMVWVNNGHKPLGTGFFVGIKGSGYGGEGGPVGLLQWVEPQTMYVYR